MLTFHHLDPSQSHLLNAKMSTFVAVCFTLTCYKHIWHVCFSLFLLFPPLSVVDRKVGRQDDCNFSQTAICTQLL